MMAVKTVTTTQIDIDPDVLSFLKGLPDEFLVCRDEGHWWERDLSGYLRESLEGDSHKFVYTKRSRCKHCGNERVKEYGPDFGWLATRYSPPKNYYARGFKLPRAALRLYLLSIQGEQQQELNRRDRRPRKTA
jgi:hypothetical protein